MPDQEPEPPYLREEIVTITVKLKYNPNYGDDRLCKRLGCGHAYYRHFDTYDNMESVGCKYCLCGTFKE